MIESYAYTTCEHCGGSGYAPLFGSLFIRCRKCAGTGQRMRPIFRAWRLIRHGATRGEY